MSNNVDPGEMHFLQRFYEGIEKRIEKKSNLLLLNLYLSYRF